MQKPNPSVSRAESRRSFLKKTAVAAAGASVVGGSSMAWGESAGAQVHIIPDINDPVLQEAPVVWAMQHLRDTLGTRGITARVGSYHDGPYDAGRIAVFSRGGEHAKEMLHDAGVTTPDSPEALALARGQADKNPALLVSGADARGLVYGLLEVADRVRFASDPLDTIRTVKRVAQKPANQIRGISRLFTSNVEDMGWYNDRFFWDNYLTELATQRFNRFNLGFGLGYDFTSNITDCYFHFAYPFLVQPEGYDVRALPLPDDERARNLETLQFISEQTVRRGMQFYLGLWTHAYKWTDSPNANYIIEGLTSENQAEYCRDALEMLLRACPAISGVTIRTHGESGVAEGNYEFWNTVFDGVKRCGRQVGIDLHAKGINQQIIDSALATGMPVIISPKFWAEHMGLGYMQGAIRPQEMPPRDRRDRGFFSLSNGSRSFMRYGYGDLLTEDRRYGVMHRVWPGTQRLLLWGDPEMAADYGRVSSFCGSLGVEWLEPLTFKGRKGSGLPGGRDAYADESLRAPGGDFEKYTYSYRVWGRHIYDPDCDSDEWRRHLNHEFGRGAASAATALGEASRILPLFLTAHCPSAANNNYWPEMYWNMPVVNVNHRNPYSDTPTPKRFGAVSPLDPEFFSRIDDFAETLLKGAPDGKYSPAWVAATLEGHAVRARAALAKARTEAANADDAAFRRLAADVEIQSGLGEYYSWKLRAGILFAIYERSHDKPALEEALKAYRKARDAWAAMADGAKPIYRSDVTFGPEYFQRGHWLDRLPAMDADIADMENLSTSPASGPGSIAVSAGELAEFVEAVLRPAVDVHPRVLKSFHTPLAWFSRGRALDIRAEVDSPRETRNIDYIQLRYRRLNQSEIWQEVGMSHDNVTYQATIPAEYADSPFPMQYHFVVHDKSGSAWPYPGLKGWRGQPYFVVRSA